MKRPPDIDAEYKGEWIVTERSFSVQAGSKTYSWEIEAEVPAMRYSVDGGEYELGPADWIDDSKKLDIELPDEMKSGLQTSKKEDLAGPPPEGAVKWLATTAADIYTDGWIAHKSGLIAGVALRSAVGYAAPAVLTGGASVPVQVGLMVAHVAIAYKINKVGQKAKAYAVARYKARAERKAKEKKPPMPGWPAINFRRGKKPGASATKKAAAASKTSMYGCDLIFDKEDSVASFEMSDGSIKELTARGLTMALKLDDKQIWSTETLFVPLEGGTKVPMGAYLAAYCATLTREAMAYFKEFVADKSEKPEKDLQGSIKLICA